MKKLMSFILSSLVIGNVIAWVMGAAPIDFEQRPYSAAEQMTLEALTTELKENPQDTAVLVELGSTYSLHNELEKADELLQQAMQLAPEDPQVLAWYSANNTKRSGAMVDLSFGMYKMYKLSAACEGLSEAVGKAPNDLTVRMLRLATFANIGKVNSLFEQVFDDEKWFNALLTNANGQLPDAVKSQFYLAMAQAYLNRADGDSAAKLEHYMALYEGTPSSSAQDNVQFKTIETRFAQADRGSSWK